MAEHTPAPAPHRAVYGFTFFILFKTLLVLYMLWAFVPEHILEKNLHLTYLPDKYFALFLPILVMVAIMIFGFLIYPSMNFAITDNINVITTIEDKYGIKRCKYILANNVNTVCERSINSNELNKNVIDWSTVDNFCEHHQNLKFERQQNSRNVIQLNQNQINNYCDCYDKTKCLLVKNRILISELNKRKTVPSVSDLDITDVCKELFL